MIAALVLAALATAPAWAMGGAELAYTLECAGCHRADGTGTPGSVPALRDSVGRFLDVPGGREYLARVPGVAQAPLDDAALAGVLNWMLDRFDRGHLPRGFVPYTAEEVGRLRAQPLTDVDAARRGLVETMTAGSRRSPDGP